MSTAHFTLPPEISGPSSCIFPRLNVSPPLGLLLLGPIPCCLVSGLRPALHRGHHAGQSWICWEVAHCPRKDTAVRGLPTVTCTARPLPSQSFLKVWLPLTTQASILCPGSQYPPQGGDTHVQEERELLS